MDIRRASALAANIAETDIADAELGAVKPGEKASMNQRLWAIIARRLEDRDATRLLRGAARNYM